MHTEELQRKNKEVILPPNLTEKIIIHILILKLMQNYLNDMTDFLLNFNYKVISYSTLQVVHM